MLKTFTQLGKVKQVFYKRHFKYAFYYFYVYLFYLTELIYKIKKKKKLKPRLEEKFFMLL